MEVGWDLAESRGQMCRGGTGESFEIAGVWKDC